MNPTRWGCEGETTGKLRTGKQRTVALMREDSQFAPPTPSSDTERKRRAWQCSWQEGTCLGYEMEMEMEMMGKEMDMMEQAAVTMINGNISGL